MTTTTTTMTMTAQATRQCQSRHACRLHPRRLPTSPSHFFCACGTQTTPPPTARALSACLTSIAALSGASCYVVVVDACHGVCRPWIFFFHAGVRQAPAEGPLCLLQQTAGHQQPWTRCRQSACARRHPQRQRCRRQGPAWPPTVAPLLCVDVQRAVAPRWRVGLCVAGAGRCCWCSCCRPKTPS